MGSSYEGARSGPEARAKSENGHHFHMVPAMPSHGRRPNTGLGSYSPPPMVGSTEFGTMPTVGLTDVDRRKRLVPGGPTYNGVGRVDLTEVDRNGHRYGGWLQAVPGGTRGNRMPGGANDQQLFNLVCATHYPDDRQQLLDVSSLFDYAQLILLGATLTTNPGGEADTAWEAATANLEVTEELPVVIDEVLCEMGGSDSHTSTMAVLSVLERHSWEAKIVVTLAALAVKYGDFLILSQIYSHNHFAKAIGMLKKNPAATATSANLDSVRSLISLILQLTSHVVRFSQHQSTSDCFPHDDTSITAVFDTFPMTAYWIVRSTVTAATHISIVAACSTTHDQFMMSSERELTMQSEKLNTIFRLLDEKMTYVEKIIDEKREEKAYNQLLMSIFEMEHRYNTTVISTLISSSAGQELSFFRGSEKVSLDILKAETVLLLITSQDERIDVLLDIYDELRECNFSIIWIPVVEGSTSTWNDSMISDHQRLRLRMPWYSVENPSLIRKEVIRFFKKELNFNGLPTLIPMDSRGKITTMNVLHMIKIWKKDAFPFTRTRCVELWNARSELTLDLFLPNDIDHTISRWAREDKYIFAYGGEVDIEWIRKFNEATRSVAKISNMQIECIYFGKSCKMEMVRNITNSMEAEKLGNYLEIDTIQVFWRRLESMIHSRLQLDMVDDESDTVMREINRITSYDKSTSSWVMICKGSKVISCVSGTAIHEVLVKYEEWKAKVDVMGAFEDALLAQIRASRTPDHNCFRFEFPTAAVKIPRAMKCPGCEKHMQLYTTFLCCHDGDTLAK